MQTQTLPAQWRRRFFTIWTGQTLSMFGSSVVQFALVWWLTISTGSATVLALASLMGILPMIVAGPLAGTLVDRWNRRVVMMVSDSFTAVVSLGLVLLFASGNAQAWHVYAAMLLRSLAAAFQQPAMQVSTSLMVPSQHLTRVAGLNSFMSGLSSIVTPAIGALLITAKLPIEYILALDIVTAIPAVLPLFFIPVPEPVRKAHAAHGSPQKSSVWQEFLEGLRYVRAWPGLLLLMCMAMLLNFLLSPASALLPLLVKNYFRGDAQELALMEGVFGVGLIAGGALLGIWGGFKRRILTSLVGIFGIGAGTLIQGLAPANAFWMPVAAMVLVGLMLPIANGPIGAIMQAAVEPGMQGRVNMLIGSVATAMTPLSLMIAGPVADAISIQGWFIAAGLTCLVASIVALFIPALMHIEEGSPAQKALRAQAATSSERAPDIPPGMADAKPV